LAGSCYLEIVISKDLNFRFRPTADVRSHPALRATEQKESHPGRGGFDSWNRVVPLNLSDTTSDLVFLFYTQLSLPGQPDQSKFDPAFSLLIKTSLPISGM
jgi:hypothetical protein